MSFVKDGESALNYFVLDVFTESRLTGNPLAVVLNPGILSPETMQAIAREMNLSETTFVERRAADVERREGVRVRIFTTDEECPLPDIQHWERRACCGRLRRSAWLRIR
jgi:PhzF family phenazine biosynthesis protein